MDLRMQNLQTPVVVIKTVFKGNPKYVKVEASSECVLITNSWIEAVSYVVNEQIKEIKDTLAGPIVFNNHTDYAGEGTVLEHPYYAHKWLTYNDGSHEAVVTVKFDIVRIRFEDIDMKNFYKYVKESYPIEKPKMANDFKEY